MTSEVFFPFSPEYATWDEWNGNFLIYYAQEPIAQLPEIQWRDVAAQISVMPTFAAYPVPDSSAFINWQDWAREVTQIINGPSH
jgi:hypothetical protein